jgi:hypothetical protein
LIAQVAVHAGIFSPLPALGRSLLGSLRVVHGDELIITVRSRSKVAGRASRLVISIEEQRHSGRVSLAALAPFDVTIASTDAVVRVVVPGDLDCAGAPRLRRVD